MKRIFAFLLIIISLSAGCAGPTQPTPEPTPSTIPITAPTSQPVSTWLSAGPRGIQFTSDFQLVQVLRDEEVYYADFKLASNGKDIYGLRMPSYPDRYASLVRLYGSEEGQLQREEILNFNELTDPTLWDPGINLSGAIIGVALFNSGDDLLSVASNGDLFLVAGAWSGDSSRGAPPLGVSLIVIHPDGSRQKVITIQELGESDLLDLTNADRGASLAVAASAPDRLWVKTETFPTGAMGFTSFYQVLDPNGDGDWSDRTILPLSLPAFLLAGEGEERWWEMRQMVSEPSLAGEDHSRSFLLPVINQQGEFRIYRISDINHDGDALDNGELDLVFKGLTASPMAHGGRPGIIAPRLMVRNGELVLQELVISSITGLSRVSRLLKSGELIDVARAFSNFEELLTDTEGSIYVVTQLPMLDKEGIQFVIYKLRPLAEGEKTEPSMVTVSPEPSTTPELVTGAITPEVPRIAFTRAVYGPGDEKKEVYLIGADGSGPSKLLQGAHNSLCCQSLDGSRMFYFSDEEVPHEQFVYVANADGSNPEKVTENPRVTSICGFTEERLLLTVGTMVPATFIRHDLKSGEETLLLTDVPEWSVSPDGQLLVFVSGLDYTTVPTSYLPRGDESLEVLDIDTSERRILHGPLKNMSYLRFWWSPNGQRLCYLVGPWRHKRGAVGPNDFDLYVTDLPSGETNLVYRLEGAHSLPSVTWSPSGSWLLVEVEREGPIEEEIPESGGQVESPSISRMGRVQERLLVHAETGEVHPWQVDGENVIRYGWAPNEDSLVYRVGQNLYSQSVDGDVRKLAAFYGNECQDYDSIGWSPDGRYIGLSGYWQAIAILDTTTGEARILFQEDGENTYIFPYGWWQ